MTPLLETRSRPSLALEINVPFLSVVSGSCSQPCALLLGSPESRLPVAAVARYGMVSCRGVGDDRRAAGRGPGGRGRGRAAEEPRGGREAGPGRPPHSVPAPAPAFPSPSGPLLQRPNPCLLLTETYEHSFATSPWTLPPTLDWSRCELVVGSTLQGLRAL